MNNQKEVQVREHSFDGIEEYDNDLPRWWVGLFILTIIFSAGYMLWYESPFFKPKTLEDEFDASKKEALAFAEEAAKKNGPGGFDYAAAIADPTQVAAGKETFEQICASCHGAQGEGLVGPNLTDDFWLHGHTLAEVEKVVADGILQNGMPAWGEILGMPKIHQIVSFIKTIQGTQPPNPKASQGEPGRLE